MVAFLVGEKMTTEQILNLDYRNNKNKEIINSVLVNNIKFLSKYQGKKVPQIEVENFIGFICRKFQISPQWIETAFLENEINMYSVSIVRTDTREWLGNVYGHCMLELLNKMAIKLYWEVKTKKIPLRKK